MNGLFDKIIEKGVEFKKGDYVEFFFHDKKNKVYVGQIEEIRSIKYFPGKYCMVDIAAEKYIYSIEPERIIRKLNKNQYYFEMRKRGITRKELNNKKNVNVQRKTWNTRVLYYVDYKNLFWKSPLGNFQIYSGGRDQKFADLYYKRQRENKILNKLYGEEII